MIYLKIKQKVDYLLEANNMINIISNKSNNQIGDTILNMTVFIKDYKSFYAFSKSADAMKFDV